MEVSKKPAGKGNNASSLFTCTTLVRDGAGPVPADYKQDLILQALMGLSKSTCANGLIKLKPVYVTNLHKEKLDPRLDYSLKAVNVQLFAKLHTEFHFCVDFYW